MTRTTTIQQRFADALADADGLLAALAAAGCPRHAHDAARSIRDRLDAMALDVAALAPPKPAAPTKS